MEVSTHAGTGRAGYLDGQRRTALFTYPGGMAFDRKGNLFVAECENHRVRKISSDGVVTTFAGSSEGFLDGQGVTAKFAAPNDIAIDSRDNIYVADRDNYRIRMISQDGEVTTLAGNARGFADGVGLDARFDNPSSVAVDCDDNLYVADTLNHRIRKITPHGHVSTLAGTGEPGFQDNPIASSAKFNEPASVAVNSEGWCFVADYFNHCIRSISPSGEVTTLAGDGTAGRVDGTGDSARFNYPCGVAVDGDGNVIVADKYNHCIRKITPNKVVTTLAGNGVRGFSNGRGEVDVQFSHPYGVAIDQQGDILVADFGNNTIRKVEAHLAPPVTFLTITELPATLSSDLSNLLVDERTHDVKFRVGSELTSAHRIILSARCEYFNKMFTSGFKEGGRPDEVCNVEETTMPAFKFILRYLYTDKAELPDEIAIDVLSLAHRYNIETLYNYCTRQCIKRIDDGNAVQWFVQAQCDGLADLRAAAKRYLFRNFRRIRQSNPDSIGVLGDHLDGHPDLLKEVLRKAI